MTGNHIIRGSRGSLFGHFSLLTFGDFSTVIILYMITATTRVDEILAISLIDNYFDIEMARAVCRRRRRR